MAVIDMVTGFIEFDVLLRVLLAFVLGLIIALESVRAGHGKDVRGAVMVCVTAAFLMTAAQGFFLGESIAVLGASIIIAMGIFGAGMIRDSAGDATTVWALAGLGIVVGLGIYFEAVLAAVLFFILLRFRKPDTKKRKR